MYSLKTIVKSIILHTGKLLTEQIFMTRKICNNVNWWILTKFIVVITSQHFQISNHYIVHLCCCCCSVANLCPTLCDPMNCTSGFPVLPYLPEFAQTHVHWVNDVIQLSHPPSSPLLLLPSIFHSIRVFSNDSVLHIRWPKYWSFSFSLSPSNEYSGLISFRMDWLDLLAVQETLKSLLQHHSSKASVASVLSFLYSPTLTSIHDYWKNHSFDYMDLCWQGNVSAF